MSESPPAIKVEGRASLSVLIVARDEELLLPDCLASAAFADEIVVALDRSSDGSADIARRKGARIVEGAWPNEGERRNTAIAACAGDWVLELDADERISIALRDEVLRMLVRPQFDYYLIPFHNHVGGVWVRWGWGAYNGVGAKTALFRRGTKHWGDGLVHPKIALDGNRGWLTGHIDHYVDDNLTAMIGRLNRYSSAAARDAVAQKRIPSALGTFRRFFSRFFKSYVSRRGYREGWRGVALGLFSALYPVLTYLKIREIGGHKD